MTDDAMKDLVSRHDSTITSLVSSVEHLVSSQAETNKRLEEISKFLAKQQVFGTKFDLLNNELTDSFKRVHKRIDKLDETQSSESGCNSVKLLHKDVLSIAKDVTRLIGTTEEHRIRIETAEKHIIPRSVMTWISGIVIMYTVTFGVYVVKSFNTLEKIEARQEGTLTRDLEDTKWLMKIHREERRSK